jgi:uncharacterized protein
MTPEQADALFDRHCTAEAERDLPAIMATLADGAEHDLVGDPDGVLTDPSAIEKRYRTMFDTFANDTLTPLRRYHGPDFFVDESLFEGDIVGEFMGLPGRNRRITFRLVHICETRDGRISRESVWMDSAAVVAQLSA